MTPGLFSLSGDGQTAAVSGAGSNIGGTDDFCEFVYFDWTGNGTLVAKVNSYAGYLDIWSKSGLMLRESSDSKSRMVGVFSYYQTLTAQQSRSTYGGTSSIGYMNALSLSSWLRVQRVGSRISSWRSDNGVDWQPYTSFVAQWNSRLSWGLFVASKRQSDLLTTTFSSVTFRDGGCGDHALGGGGSEVVGLDGHSGRLARTVEDC